MTINQDILTYARQQLNTRVGDGECWTFAETAVTGAGGVSSRVLTPNFGAQANYVWGDPRAIATLAAGHIVQLRNYRWVHTVEEDVTFADGGGGTSTQTSEVARPHHTVIVNGSISGGMVEVLEQNAPPGSSVHTTTMCFAVTPTPPRTTYEQRPNPNNNNRTERATVVTRVTNTVSGNIWGYQARTP